MKTEKTMERLEEIEGLLNKYYASEDGFEQTELAMEIIQSHVGWLISIAKGVSVLERENSWAYGRLNMISDIIEKARVEANRGDFNA